MKSTELLPDWSRQFDSLPTSIGILKTDKNDSDKSVSDTVGMMARHAVEAKNSLQVNQAVKDSGALGTRFDREKIACVFAYIKMRVRFVEDDSQLANLFNQPQSKELLITPPVLLSMTRPIGDCDDFSMLCCSMLLNLGIQCNFVTVAADRTNPSQYTHVYCMAVTKDGHLIPLDTSHGKYPGWEVANVSRKQLWPVIDISTLNIKDGIAGMFGLGDDDFDPYANVGSDYQIGSPVTITTQIPYPTVTVPGTASGINWNALLPGLFGSVEKIAVQTTQQPGIQTTGPNGQSMSQVLAPGQSQSVLSSTNLFGSTPSSSLPIIAVAIVVGLFLFSRKS